MAEIICPSDNWPEINAVYSNKDSLRNDRFLAGVRSLSAIVTVDEVLDDDFASVVQPSLTTLRRAINFKTWPDLEASLLIPISGTLLAEVGDHKPAHLSSFHEFLAYRSSVEPWLLHDKQNFEDQCRVEWETAFKGFLKIENRNIQLCMAAWATLNMSLQDQCQAFTTEDVALAIEVVADMLNDFHEQSSPGERRRRLSHLSLARLSHHTTQFRLLVTELLTPSAVVELKSHLHETLRAIYERAVWHSTTRRDNKTYLKVQSACSGLGAMFYLAHMSTLAHLSASSPILESMQSLVSEAAILQNDIFGIEASLLNDPLENHVLLAANPSIRLLPVGLQSRCLAPSIKSLVKRHNKTSRDVLDHYRQIYSNNKLRHERTSADMLIDFLGAHLNWEPRSTHNTRQDNSEVQQSVDFCAIGTLQKILQDLK